MSTKETSRHGCNQATRNASSTRWKDSRFASFLKAAIVSLALWGFISVCIAEWLIHHGGLRDA